MTSMKSRLIAIGLALAILATGAAAGIAVDRWMGRPEVAQGRDRTRSPSVDRQLARFRKRLDLTDAQSEAIRAILERTKTEMDAIDAEVQPRVRGVRDRSRGEILQVLEPEQRTKYEDMIERSKRHRQRRQGGDRPSKRRRSE
jgi:Spy/CpxP family protein refolding chaperone